MNPWEEIEKLDSRIIADKEKLYSLMQKRKDLHRGLRGALKTIDKGPVDVVEKAAVPESIVEKIANAGSDVEDMEVPQQDVKVVAKDEFIPPTQEKIAKMWRDHDANPRQ